jgi:dolichol-phosphate mannosyltransferase
MESSSMATNPVDLIIIMPVYNEQASVRKVVMEWFQEVENWTENFVFLAIDDGSKDRTPQILARLRDQLGSRLEIHTHTNRGHGQSCVAGYRLALQRRTTFVLQIDSDGQCDPQYFFRFWRMREQSDVIYGKRGRREDGWRRVVASFILKWTLFIFAHVLCVDANVPYRLMRTEKLASVLAKIPEDFFLANVALAVLLRRQPGIRHHAIPIRFRERYGGEPSVALGKFGEKARELIAQVRRLQ